MQFFIIISCSQIKRLILKNRNAKKCVKDMFIVIFSKQTGLKQLKYKVHLKSLVNRSKKQQYGNILLITLKVTSVGHNMLHCVGCLVSLQNMWQYMTSLRRGNRKKSAGVIPSKYCGVRKQLYDNGPRSCVHGLKYAGMHYHAVDSISGAKNVHIKTFPKFHNMLQSYINSALL